MVVRRLLLDILVFLHRPPLQGVPGWCYAFSLLWPEQLPALLWGAVLGGDGGISRQDLWDELGQLFPCPRHPHSSQLDKLRHQMKR